MPVIVDATIIGKLDPPIMSNVASSNDKIDFSRASNGLINIADKNVARINQSKGIPAIPAQIKTMSEGAKQSQTVAKANSTSIGESVKGQSIDATA